MQRSLLYRGTWLSVPSLSKTMRYRSLYQRPSPGWRINSPSHGTNFTAQASLCQIWCMIFVLNKGKEVNNHICTQSIIILTISQNDIHVWLEVCGKNKDGNVIACPHESKQFDYIHGTAISGYLQKPCWNRTRHLPTTRH